MLRLVELHVRKYRDLVDGGPLRFGPGPVFLLGPNGSGKTTLLELIGVLLGDDLGPLFKEEDAVELSWVLEAESKHGPAPVYLSQTLSISKPIAATAATAQSMLTEIDGAQKREWKNSLQFSSQRKSTDGPTIELAHDVSPKFNSDLELASTHEWPDRATDSSFLPNLFLHLGRVSADTPAANEQITEISEWIALFLHVLAKTSRFEEALEAFQFIVGGRPDQKVASAQSFVNGTPANPAALFGVPHWPRALIRWDLTVPIDALKTNDDPLYQMLLRLLGAERIELHPRLSSDNGRGRRVWHGFELYVHWGGGAIHHHSQLSFGQKRLIAMVWNLGYSAPVPLLTDEMTNGLHAGWVQAIIDHIGPRQGFHAVQNPLLLDRYGPGEQAEDIAGRFVICTVVTAERGRQWRWRSPTPEECERLWQAYIAGYQHLSELLISEGLW